MIDTCPNLVEVAPYSHLARVYDETIGRRFFWGARRRFVRIAHRYGIAPRVAADVGCGTGRFARYLARRFGARVYAVDLSLAMLRQASRACGAPSVIYLRQDIRALRLPEPVDLVIANYDVFNHLVHPGDVAAALSRIRAALRPGGFFVFDIITPNQPLRRVAHGWRLPHRTTMVQRVAFGPGHRIRVTIRISEMGGRSVRVECHRERAYEPVVFARWLLEAGFRLRGVHDARTMRPAGPDAPRVVFVAQAA